MTRQEVAHAASTVSVPTQAFLRVKELDIAVIRTACSDCVYTNSEHYRVSINMGPRAAGKE